jgi:hypothetical protein
VCVTHLTLLLSVRVEIQTLASTGLHFSQIVEWIYRVTSFLREYSGFEKSKESSDFKGGIYIYIWEYIYIYI